MKLESGHNQIVQITYLKGIEGKTNTQGWEEMLIQGEGIVTIVTVYPLIFTRDSEILKRWIFHFRESFIQTSFFGKNRNSWRVYGAFPWRRWVHRVLSYIPLRIFSHITIIVSRKKRRNVKQKRGNHSRIKKKRKIKKEPSLARDTWVLWFPKKIIITPLNRHLMLWKQKHKKGDQKPETKSFKPPPWYSSAGA